MKFRFLIDENSAEAAVIRELLRENSHEAFASGGVPVRIEEIGAEGGGKPQRSAAEISRDEGGFVLRYTGRSALCRGIGLLVRYAGEKPGFTLREEASFDTLGVMLDCSRNAVMKPEKVKQMIRMASMMGYNALMIYTEDTYEIPGSPYFGHLRGRYTKEELQDIDAYAQRFGIELIPCIQMLAHLNAIFEWWPYGDMSDRDDILNLADERSYDLLREMAKTVSETFTSRRINIGMDEAYMLGRGRYLEAKGYEKSSQIMMRHLERVMEILREYGLQPRMWSDMFFRMCTPDESYYNPDCTVTDEVRAAIPPEMTLIYWDYFGTEEERYDYMMANHFKMTDRIAFAGGASCWYGLVPLNRFAVNSARAALGSAEKNGMRELYVTMWGDDGAVCSSFAALPTLVCYGEANWNGRTDDDNLRAAMAASCGADFDAFRDFEELENFACRADFGQEPKNPTRYLFWQDVLQGKFDRHVPADACGRYTAAIFRMMEDRQKCHPKYGYLFDSFSALSDVLRIKADLGIRLKQAYDADDRDMLKALAEEEIPETLRRVEAFRKVLRTQWMTDNKPFGFDMQDLRLGGLVMRLQEASETVNEYLEGKVSSVPELEAPRLPYTPETDADDVTIGLNNWKRFATSSVLMLW